MAVSFVGLTSNDNHLLSNPLTLASGATVGDVAVLLVQHRSSAPTGYTAATTTADHDVYYRVLTGSDPTPTITTAVWVLAVFRGVDNTTPIEGLNLSTPAITYPSSTTSTPVNLPTVTATRPGMYFAVEYDFWPTTGGSETSTFSAGLTERLDTSTGGSSHTSAATETIPVGASPARTLTFVTSPSSNGGSTASLAVMNLRDANVAPTITATSPADAAITKDATPDLTVAVTDPDASQTLTVTYEVSTSPAFGSLVWSGTAAQATPASATAVAKTVGTTLSSDTLYYWRAKVSDGVATSSYTTARSFYVNRRPVVTLSTPPYKTVQSPSFLPRTFVPPGSYTVAWSHADPDGDAQTEWAIVLQEWANGFTTSATSVMLFWNGSAWTTTSTYLTGTDTSDVVSFSGRNLTTHTLGVATKDTFGTSGSFFPLTAEGYVVVRAYPTVTITAPADGASLTTGGPNLTVSWTFAQADGSTQRSYRVRFLNDAGTTTYYDTGEVMATTTSLVFDLVALGIPTDTTDMKVTVDVTSSDGADFTATDTNSFDVLWGVVTCTILTPADESVTTASSVTPTWSFASTRSKTQGAYRVRLLTQGGTVLFDSGFISGAASSYAIPFTLSDNARYRLGIQLRNSEGVLS